MIQFPGTVEIPFRSTILKFSIVPIDKNIYAMSNDMSLIKNDDKMTFGYLIHKNGYLYAYGILPLESSDGEETSGNEDQKFRFDVVCSTYVGPDDITITDQAYIHNLVHTIGNAFGNRALYEVKHPSIVQRDRFIEIMRDLTADIEKFDDPSEIQTPYMQTMLQTAESLAEFYTTMVKNLKNLTSESDT